MSYYAGEVERTPDLDESNSVYSYFKASAGFA